jgi:putative transposase
VTTTLHKIVEISKKISQKWAIIAKRWIVERTFAWINNFRQTSKDYEIYTTWFENAY